MPQTADWYHCHVARVLRSEGKSAVGLAAYITGERLWDAERQRVAKRAHPGDVLAWGTIAPDHAPAWMTDPANLARLWNEAQQQERRKDSRLARHMNVALSREFDEATRIAAIQDMAKAVSERYGVVVTWAVHEPTDHGSGINHHAHLAFNERPVAPEGFAAEKDFRLKHQDKAELLWQREMVADVLNAHLERIGSEERVDHRSYKDQGRDKIPMRHLGNKQFLAEQDGQRTVDGDHNREVQADNAELEKLEADVIKSKAEFYKCADIIHLENIQRFKEGKRVEVSEDESASMPDAEAMLLHDWETKVKLEEQLFQTYLLEKEHEARKREEERSKGVGASTEGSPPAEQTPSITDPYLRYSEALAGYRASDGISGLIGVAAREHAAFAARQQDLKNAEARAGDIHEARELRLVRLIEANEYMAVTTERCAQIARASTPQQAESYKERAAAHAGFAEDYKEQLALTRRQREQREASAQPRREEGKLLGANGDSSGNTSNYANNRNAENRPKGEAEKINHDYHERQEKARQQHNEAHAGGRGASTSAAQTGNANTQSHEAQQQARRENREQEQQRLLREAQLKRERHKEMAKARGRGR